MHRGDTQSLTVVLVSAYMSFHMTRKVPSVVASTLNPSVSFDPWGNPENEYAGWAPFSTASVT